MLQLLNICKSYTTGKLVQKALDNVSLNLRDSEFVAILGPSGSGKTTLLNIIGGLDHYDSGDLVINGVSTKKYRDRDWDSYRNHSVGFVFQSYNLIPHQTILANVELALTISGIGKRERRRRAAEALEKVGLADQMHKLPEQLSGGQMQRVAIARALVNDPHILLADEPTGALDSDTSVQVMELLKEVAKDRLVVMVTHNPELADSYATRIIKLRDGKVRSDSDPFTQDSIAAGAAKPVNTGKASMSFPTALSLSFNNLKTKKARTFLTSFAGSIGIIGIALILAASSGVNEYIASEQEAMLYAYPIEFQKTNVDISSFFGGGTSNSEDDEIGIVKTMTRLFSTVGSNDLKTLRTYFESGETDIYDHVNAIDYTYYVEPQIFMEEEDGYRQVNPNSTLSDVNMGILSANGSPMAALFSSNVFYQLPESESVYADQYEVVSGRWPESYDECVVVLNSNGNISDVMMYVLGLRDSLELEDMVEQFLDGEAVDMPDDFGVYEYDDIPGIQYKLAFAPDFYEYDSEYGIWTDKTDDEEYMQSLVENGETLEVVGVVRSSSDSQSTLLQSGIYYTSMLTEHLALAAADTQIVKDQLADPDIDVFTGEEFGDDTGAQEADLSSLFEVDSDAVADAFEIDTESIEESLTESVDMSEYMNIDTGAIDLSGMMDLGDISLSVPSAGLEDVSLADIIGSLDITVTMENVSNMASRLLEGYREYSADDPRADISLLPGGFVSYLHTDEVKKILSSNIAEIIEANGDITVSQEQISELTSLLAAGFQNYAQQQGYTDGELTAQYFIEYMQTAEAQAIVSAWVSQNLDMNTDAAVTQEQLQKIVSELSDGYTVYADANGLPTAQTIGESFIAYLGTDGAQAIVTDGILHMIDVQSLENRISSAIEGYIGQMTSAYGSAIASAIESQMTSAMQSVMGQISDQLTSGMERVMRQLAVSMGSSLANALSVDSNTLMDAFGLSIDVSQLTELLTSLTSAEGATYSGNLQQLGYADFDDPYAINIYPKDFESKEAVIEIIDSYNERMLSTGDEDRVISYSDMTGTLMSSVTEMVDIVSIVMICVVAVSLVVSSIMIGVITYISVLERKKEIGILRALGASKRNISDVFNAETIIIGLCSGILGVFAAYLLTIPINSVIHGYFEMENVRVFLPALYAVILVAISVGLTLFSGLIPSSKAAKSDPVEALRTE